MNNLNKRALKGLVFFFVAMAVLIFLPSSTFWYWQAWVYLAAFFVPVVLITLYLIKRDRALLERRMSIGSTAEKERSQKVIQFIAQFAFIAVYVVSSLDHRAQFSVVPLWCVLLADVFVVLGLFIVFLVFKENTYTSATVEIADNQQVIATGPYAWVRHPMYSGALLMLGATPVALGSWWGLLTFIPMTFVIVWRLRAEETYLIAQLPGYAAYRAKVHARLIPYNW